MPVAPSSRRRDRRVLSLPVLLVVAALLRPAAPHARYQHRVYARGSSRSRGRLRRASASGALGIPSAAPTGDDDDDDATPRRPLAVRTFLIGASALTRAERKFLQRRVLRPAVSTWSSALSVVRRASGPLSVDPGQLYDGRSCGPGADSGYPSPLVPPQHLAGTGRGVSGADLLLYVTVTVIDEDDDDADAGRDDDTDGFRRREDGRPDPLDDDRDVRTFGEEDITVDTEEELLLSDPGGHAAVPPPPEAAAPDTDGPDPPPADDADGGLRLSYACPTPDHVASATYCATDAWDRPIAGTLHFCIRRGRVRTTAAPSPSGPDPIPGEAAAADDTGGAGADDPAADPAAEAAATAPEEMPWDPASFFHPLNHAHAVAAAVHEIGHVLGMNVQSMAHFRDARGAPLVERDGEGDVVDTEVECTGPAAREDPRESAARTDPVVPAPRRRTEVMAVPGENVLGFFEVRGGVRVAMVVTENVQLYARNQFDCQDLPGAELESGLGSWIPPDHLSPPPNFEGVENVPSSHIPFSPSPCIGDHWERRLFKSDTMNPIVPSFPSPQTNRSISALTLALMMDSGWYHVNLTVASLVDGWGRGRGCAFVDEPCVDPVTGEVAEKNRGFFCSRPLSDMDTGEDTVDASALDGALREIHGCTEDFSRKAVCSLRDFAEGEEATGGDAEDDRTEPPAPPLSFIPPEYQYLTATHGPTFGGADADLDFCPVYEGFSNGLCSDPLNEAALRVHDMEEFGTINSRCLPARIKKRETGLCLPTACVISDRSLRIKVEGVWRVCNQGGQKLGDWWDMNQYIVCPDPWRTCTAFFCPHNCLGMRGGICDYETGQCICDKHLEEEDGIGLTQRGDGTCIPHQHNFTAQFYNVERLTTSLAAFYVSNVTSLVDDAKTTTQKVHRFFSLMTQAGAAFFIIFSAICLSSMGIASYRLFGQRYYRALRNHRVPHDTPPSAQHPGTVSPSFQRNIPSSVYHQFITQARWKLDHIRHAREGPRRGMSRAARRQFEEEGKVARDTLGTGARRYTRATASRVFSLRGARCFTRETARGFARGTAARDGHHNRAGLVTLNDIHLGPPDSLLTIVSVDSDLTENTFDDDWTASGRGI
eukprot:CAMPEP_0194316948 /NCGR_PEP_ID=MMETSP0171-20130528/13691_1 /TAXON_ID=218684 /ORGANISM="Corethron pennatum, Strain L29A3" /LENGTH=1106 /DNA_ID=CAMNT_0039073361 /DNA_START=322 /DNA_END=3642 /DNA_ORIENTATION=+